MKKKKSESQKEASVSTQLAKEKTAFELVLTPKFLEQCQYWSRQDSKTLKKILDLIESTLKNPFEGIGKPEALRHEGSGLWSRKIDETNRFVYKVDKGKIELLQCRFHYND